MNRITKGAQVMLWLAPDVHMVQVMLWLAPDVHMVPGLCFPSSVSLKNISFNF